MIPLRDNVGASRLPPVNTLLIAANLLVFAWEVRLGAAANVLLGNLGMVPERVASLGVEIGPSNVWVPATLLTSLFLHGGVLHVAGNMLYLFIFGPAVEARLGGARYVCFYLLSGVVAGLAMVWMEPYSPVPVIGASGAIAGVLGAYFVLYPRARILTILPIFFVVEFVELPAVVYLLLWFAAQLYAGLSSAAAGRVIAGGVAWWAHVGGFLFGLALAPILARRTRRRGRRIW